MNARSVNRYCNVLAIALVAIPIICWSVLKEAVEMATCCWLAICEAWKEGA